MFRFTEDTRISKAVKIWLLTGLLMVFMQIVIGGITRLTGSGLSITRWEIVTGALPPLNEAQWQDEFALYQQTPQYHKINQGMSLDAFKFIYFWEYFHRLWARLMFFVFVIPFAFFLYRGMFSRRLLPRMLIVVALAGLEGFFGWIMVASGLIQRPWVNAYNLTLHLCMAIVIFNYLLWTIFIVYQPIKDGAVPKRWGNKFAWSMVALAFIQIALGAMMSGTKAGLSYPTWPDMNGHYLPGILLDGSSWVPENFRNYDINAFMPTLIQFLHRNTAYLLSALIFYFVWRINKQTSIPRLLRLGNIALTVMLLLQVLLGIFTLIHCKGSIPVTLGVLHQAGAIFLMGILLFVTYLMETPDKPRLTEN
ncbi:MAG: COX15/CtaA family protein [Saprospiraceae bacterium]|nr:COX15/CtaA family protein [Saprospiraceae bacterium]